MARTSSLTKSVKAPVKTDKTEKPVDRSILERKLGFRLRMAERAIYKVFIQNVGMTPIQYSLFALVAQNEGLSQGLIGEALNLDRATTMAIMERLESAGLIERRKSLVDRRRHALYLTAKGKKAIVEAERKVQETDDSFKQKLNAKELSEFVRCLDVIRQR